MKSQNVSHEITIDEFVDIAKRSREEWLKLSEGLKFDINSDIHEEVFNLKVRSQGEIWDLAGLGAIGVIAGPPKSRKTAVSSAITAAGLSNEEVLGVRLDLEGGRILSFDTEQRRGSFAKVNRSVFKWAKLTYNPDNYGAYTLRDFYPDERLSLIQAHVFTPPKPKLLVIDVVTDLMYSFNDEVKSQKLVEDIMKMAGTDTLVILNIHLGKGGLILGHIGSALARKVDFLIEVKMSEEDWRESTVTCKLTRDVPMFPEFKIRQESHPPRIFRPDLEIGGMILDQPSEPSFVIPEECPF